MQDIHSNYGQRPLPSLMDKIAEEDPERVFASIPLSSDPQDGFRELTFSTFARSINRCAWWTEQSLGKAQQCETISYIGPQDSSTHPHYFEYQDRLQGQSLADLKYH